MMTKTECEKVKNLIYKSLTEDFKTVNGTNVAIFNKDSGKPMYGTVTLESVMTKVVQALYSQVSSKRRIDG